MLTLRAPRAAARYFKDRDPNTAISESYIRRLVKNGDIPTIRNGTKILVSIESIDKYLSEQLTEGVE